jgi:hypothetical protein
VRGVELLEQRTAGGVIVTRIHARKGALPADGGDLREALHRESFMRDVDALLERGRQRPDLVGGIPGQGFVVNTGAAAIALVAATAKTIMYLNSGSNTDVCLSEMCVGFDGVSASAVPALVELVLGTKASNSTPGTASTTFTPLQIRGWGVKAAQAAAANACTSEPTVLVSTKQWLVTPNGGLLVVQSPLSKEPTAHNIASTSGLQLGVRVTAPAIVNTRGYLEFDE